MAPVESITFERLVYDIFAVMDALKIERCVLAAESAGALTALAAAWRQPDRITGLVLVDALLHQLPVEDGNPFLQGLSTSMGTIDRFVTACVPEPDSDHIKRWGRQILGRASQAAAIALYRSSSEPDLRSCRRPSSNRRSFCTARPMPSSPLKRHDGWRQHSRTHTCRSYPGRVMCRR